MRRLVQRYMMKFDPDAVSLGFNLVRRDRLWPTFVAVVVAMGCGGPLVSQMSSSGEVGHDDVAMPNRMLGAEGFAALRNSIDVRPISPQAAQATNGDTVVMAQWVKPDSGVVVVRRPPTPKTIHQILPPQEGRDHREYLETEIEKAMERSADQINFPEAEVFRLSPRRAGARHLAIKGATDLTIDFRGSTLVFNDVSPGVVLQDCQRLLLKNGHFVGHGCLSTLATVEENSRGLGFQISVKPEFRPLLAKSSPDDAALVTIGTVKSDANGEPQLDRSGYLEWFVNRGRQGRTTTFDAERACFLPSSKWLIESKLMSDAAPKIGTVRLASARKQFGSWSAAGQRSR